MLVRPISASIDYNTATLTVGLTTVSPVSSVRDLDIYIDSDLVMYMYT